VSWSSKKQATVALSSAEAEYMAMCATVQEIMWTVNLLKELNLNVNEPTIMKVDNQAADAMTKRDVNHSKTKHIDIKYHFIKEAVKNNQIKIEWIESENNQADILTKALGRIKFEKLRNLIIK
jgi:polyribonucleotide nucleotidyltransferase